MSLDSFLDNGTSNPLKDIFDDNELWFLTKNGYLLYPSFNTNDLLIYSVYQRESDGKEVLCLGAVENEDIFFGTTWMNSVENLLEVVRLNFPNCLKVICSFNASDMVYVPTVESVEEDFTPYYSKGDIVLNNGYIIEDYYENLKSRYSEAGFYPISKEKIIDGFGFVPEIFVDKEHLIDLSYRIVPNLNLILDQLESNDNLNNSSDDDNNEE